MHRGLTSPSMMKKERRAWFGLGFRVWGSGFRVEGWGLELRAWGLGCRVS